ncbi:MAG: CRTAC1 family protein [Thermoguttaceae bacterium]|nr:CRTAC1 family protein [Thermoguttaceae bacterium]MDW8077805.1 CRTAC1 family protein [Thermoguttaceae bacterium]
MKKIIFVSFWLACGCYVAVCLGSCSRPPATSSSVASASRAAPQKADPAKEEVSAYVARYGMRPGRKAVPQELRQSTVRVDSCPIRLRDITPETGIDFCHTDGSSGQHYIMEAMTGGLATFDYDGDGWEDIYFLNGAPLPGTKVDVPPTNHLYRNLGHFRFQKVTDQAGVGDPSFGLGVGVADYNNDGFLDIYINNFGPNVLFRNNGDGTFTDVTAEAGVANGQKVGAGVAFFDMEQDGDVDIYVANYVFFQWERHVRRLVKGYPVYPSPRDFGGTPDTLFRNEGDGTFTDVSQSSGVGCCPGTGMGIVAADYDSDGDADVFVCNDVDANFLFVNDGKGHFEELGMLLGAAYNWYGDENASMGVDCGDYDNDGRLDFIMTSYQDEFPVLYKNMGDGRLEDVTAATNVGPPLLQYVNWGVGFADFDNDAFRDIFIANGHTDDYVEFFDPTGVYKAPNTLLWNLGTGKFADVSRLCGDGLAPVYASRGAAFEDLDNDGRIDVVVLNSRDPPTVIANQTALGNSWLEISLLSQRINRFGIGAEITVEAGALRTVAQVISGRGYQSHWGLRVHFGLGKAKTVEQITIRWPGGQVSRLGPFPANQWIIVAQTGEVFPPPGPWQTTGSLPRWSRD